MLDPRSDLWEYKQDGKVITKPVSELSYKHLLNIQAWLWTRKHLSSRFHDWLLVIEDELMLREASPGTLGPDSDEATGPRSRILDFHVPKASGSRPVERAQ